MENIEQYLESNITINFMQEQYVKNGIGFICEDGHIAKIIFE